MVRKTHPTINAVIGCVEGRIFNPGKYKIHLIFGLVGTHIIKKRGKQLAFEKLKKRPL
jgi:hypothetical protein